MSRILLCDRDRTPMCALRVEEAEELYRAGKAIPMGKRTTKLVLTVARREAWGFLRGNRSIQSQASRMIIVERVGEERSRLYQHDHERCIGYANTLMDCVTV